MTHTLHGFPSPRTQLFLRNVRKSLHGWMGLGSYLRKAVTIEDLINSKLIRSETAQRFEADKLVASGTSDGVAGAVVSLGFGSTGTYQYGTATAILTVSGKKPVLVVECLGFQGINASNIYYQMHRGYPGQFFGATAGTIIYDTSDGGVPNYMEDSQGGIIHHCFQTVDEPNEGLYQWGGVMTFDFTAATTWVSVEHMMFVTEID